MVPKLRSGGNVNHLQAIRCFFNYRLRSGTADGGTVVKVLCYKSESRWLDSRWCHWNFSLT
jgi:hypothetical protein